MPSAALAQTIGIFEVDIECLEALYCRAQQLHIFAHIPVHSTEVDILAILSARLHDHTAVNRMLSCNDRWLLAACDIHQVGDCQGCLNQRLDSLQTDTGLPYESKMPCTRPSISCRLVGVILPHGHADILRFAIVASLPICQIFQLTSAVS